MELIVLGYPERGRVLVGPAGGEAVPEGRPEGFDDESDYVVLEGRAEPQCATQR